MKIKFFAAFNELKYFMKKAGVRPGFFVIAGFLSILIVLLETISVGALVPLIKGILSADFSFTEKTPVLGGIVGFISKIAVPSAAGIFIFLISVIFISAILKNAVQYASVLTVAYQIRKISNFARQAIFNRYLSFGKLFFDRNNLGHLQNILLNFTRHVTQQLISLDKLVTHIFLLVAYLAIMLMISWKLTLVALIVLPLLSYILRFLVKKIKKNSLRYSLSSNVLSGKISNILSCMPLVKLYAREDKESEHFASLSGQLEGVEFSMDKKSNLIAPLQETILLVSVLVVISIMSFMITGDRPGRMAGFLVFFYILKRFQQSFISINSIRSSFAMVSGPIDAIVNILNDQDKFFVPDGAVEFVGLKNEIKFTHLNFSYVKEREVLKDINFAVKKGETTAIIGPTGSGKTTLISLLLRFYDCPPDSIFIDGVDIRSFTTRSLMGHMAVVSQDSLVFNDSIRNNIIYGLDDVSESRLIEAVKRARLYDFIESLPHGLDTNIGDKGVKLSGGEKQRVAIARALLKGCEILIMDEATSSIDAKTERLIHEAMDDIVRNRTSIIIAHRLSTIKKADKIIVMDAGRVIEQGSSFDLLENKGKFYEHWQEQGLKT